MQDKSKQIVRLVTAIKVNGGCWEWQQFKDKDGYGQTFVWDGKKSISTRAHRLMYELLVNKIPEDMVIDHLCRNRPCINPAHMEVVTVRTNTLRGFGPGAYNARKTHCKRGHEFTKENTINTIGSTGNRNRNCKLCKAMHLRKYRLRRKLDGTNK